ncbi:MAG: hypothetical protein IKC48_04630 [Clostridia bacterium]|nr:hypothetical protein [Clostridia bacterium]
MLHKTLTLIRVTKNFVNIGDVLKNRDLLSQIPDSEGVFFVFNKDKVEIKFAPNLTNPISGEKITVARPKKVDYLEAKWEYVNHDVLFIGHAKVDKRNPNGLRGQIAELLSVADNKKSRTDGKTLWQVEGAARLYIGWLPCESPSATDWIKQFAKDKAIFAILDKMLIPLANSKFNYKK